MLQVTSLLLNVAGDAHVVDSASAGYTKSALISTFRLLTLRTLPSIGPLGEQSQRLPGYALHDDDVNRVGLCFAFCATLYFYRCV